ncbi:peptide chain release factor 1 [Rhabdochlamydiaceae symbiont of Dictyostelium giganteum]|uniref:peptide chain release factor 1 n=1 Tax=Rhabdochlamydiaceae symbiont of Dictyostelium giganteum TaxID=3342349 RepID=UPI0038501807
MLDERLAKRVEGLLSRFQEVETSLGDPAIFQDPSRYRDLAQEHARLGKIKDLVQKIELTSSQLKENEILLKGESDPDLISFIKEDVDTLSTLLTRIKAELESLLVPPDPLDNRNVIMEIRAGTGGDEAAIFVGDCVRMYQYYADKKGWKCELLSAAPSERGGFKEYIMVISGQQVFRLLQYEAGTHRVQRIPATETQGRVHTSAVTIAVLPEPTEEEQLNINLDDLRIDTFRSSGAGGQHVNTTDSAVRITHIPTGVVVACQEERSQHKNRDKAMRLLSAKIVEEKRRKEQQEMAALRSSQVGSGDRSERIRTYNFPQNRITDHRIGVTLYHLGEMLEGDIDELAQALVTYFYEQKLAGDENNQ